MIETVVKEYIVYLETDLTVRATSTKEAEQYAKRFTKTDTYSPLVSVDETRVITSERKYHAKVVKTS